VTDPKRVYSDDEVKSILSRAIDRQRAASPDGLSHDDLLAVAREAGIPADAVEAAAAEIVTRAADGESEQSSARSRPAEGDGLAVRKERASGFRIHLLTYVPVIAFLVFVNVMTTPSYLWFLWPALGWGLAVVLHARFALFPSEVEIARDVARRAERRRRAQEKKRRREAKSALQQGARELGHAVERGVAVMLTETAKRIHEEIDPIAETRGRRVRVEDKKGRESHREEEEEDDEAEEQEERKAKR
jgi:hypothetical protein